MTDISILNEVLVMFPVEPSSPVSDDSLSLHQRLLDQDPTASNDLATQYLSSLIVWLREHNPTIQHDFISDAACDAIVSLVKRPASYHPQKSSLEYYLRLSAQGDLRNLLQKEKKHHLGRQPWNLVEHLPDRRNKIEEIEEDAVILDQEISAAVRETLTDEETRGLELMRHGERRTAVFAEALGLADRSLAEQRRLVKQFKDRLKKRIQRQGGS